ncbi:MAG: transglycosylase domain-containing protein [Stackebrandtia sp.]
MQQKIIRDRSLSSNATALLVCGLLAGLVVAAAAFPTLAVAGLTAKASADGFESLPAELKEEPPPQRTWVYAKDGSLITSFYDENRKPVSLDEVAPIMIDALIAAEDTRFYEHNGVDALGVIRAAVANQGSGEVEQGASTITMQFVRQTLTYNAKSNVEILKATEDTPERKIKEMRYAVAVEKVYSKEEILERYLNLVYLGNQSYGIHAAASAYFGKAPDELELHEAALLAALPKAPGTIDPTVDEDAQGDAVTRRNYVLDQMVHTKAISPEEAEEAKERELELDLKDQPNECVSVPSDKLDWGFFCDYLKQWWMNNERLGDSPEERLALLKRGGFEIHTTLEPDLQEKAQKHVTDRVSEKDPFAMGTVTLDNDTGSMRALALNREYSLDDSDNGEHSDPSRAAEGDKGNYPATTVPLVTGGEYSGEAGAGFQVGSTAKYFTLMAALDDGMKLDKTYRNKSPYVSKLYGAGYEPSEASCGKSLPSGELAWCPENANPSWMDRTADMYVGFGRSINTYFVQLIEEVGAPKVVEMAEKLGIDWRNPADKDRATPGCDGETEDAEAGWPCYEPDTWGSLTLGVADMTALDLARTYSVALTEGKACEPLPVESIVAPDGSELDAGDPACDQAVKRDVANAAADAMRCPVGDQAQAGKCDGATYPEAKGIVDSPIAGKTGTTDSNQASWFVAGTSETTTSGFIANPDYRKEEVPTSMLNKPHEAVSYTLRDATEGTDPGNFPEPKESMVKSVAPSNAVPAMDCVTPAEAETLLTDAGFEPVRVDDAGFSQCPAGTVFGTNAAAGSSVEYLVSSGVEPPGNDDGDDSTPSAPAPGSQSPPDNGQEPSEPARCFPRWAC